MKRALALGLMALQIGSVMAQEMRAPAYPLITHDPYFSVWSATNQLNASSTRHWTGSEQSMIGLINVDGTVYRFMGAPEKVYKSILPASDEKAYEMAYTEEAPAANWMATGFDDAAWKKGAAIAAGQAVPFGEAPISMCAVHSRSMKRISISSC